MHRVKRIALAAACAAGTATVYGETVQIEGTIRDFKGAFSSTAPFAATPGGHPHFEVFSQPDFFTSRVPTGFDVLPEILDGDPAQTQAVEPGIVSSLIGANRKPNYEGGSNPALFGTTQTKYNAANTNLEIDTNFEANSFRFKQWYNDDPINASHPATLTLDDAGSPGIYTIQSGSFFPLNGTDTPGVDVDGFTGFGNEGRANNYHYTLELHSTFTYVPGQSFTFSGDDDVWVFINDQLALDLGGVHEPLSATIDLDGLGLTPGEDYAFDFFFAERNTSASNFRIDTSIALGVDGPPPAIPLPAAVWMGLTVMGAIAARQSIRKRA